MAYEPHDAKACGECAYIPCPSYIRPTEAQRRAVVETRPQAILRGLGFGSWEDSILELGHHTMHLWRGHAMFYLFLCPNCGAYAVDYLHGMTLYMSCDACDARIPLTQERFYEERGGEPPPSFFEQLKSLWRLRKELRALKITPPPDEG